MDLMKLREVTYLAVALRVFFSVVIGGLIGLERGLKNRPAGLRTYMVVCVGACLIMLTNQYTCQVFGTGDPVRMGAQVVSGIGFLGAGTIIVTRRNQIKGLTTAAGLWASACMGLAIGAGFYECVFLAFILIFACLRIFPVIEMYIIQNARHMSIYVEFESMDNIGRIISRIKAQDVQIYEVELEHGREERLGNPSATFFLYMTRKQSHERFMSAILDLDCIYTIEEI
jgi:putative Mg2+ transporter-C (MgtC) family protein